MIFIATTTTHADDDDVIADDDWVDGANEDSQICLFFIHSND